MSTPFFTNWLTRARAHTHTNTQTDTRTQPPLPPLTTQSHRSHTTEGSAPQPVRCVFPPLLPHEHERQHHPTQNDVLLGSLHLINTPMICCVNGTPFHKRQHEHPQSKNNTSFLSIRHKNLMAMDSTWDRDSAFVIQHDFECHITHTNEATVA